MKSPNFRFIRRSNTKYVLPKSSSNHHNNHRDKR
jgi:hypothetical protein